MDSLIPISKRPKNVCTAEHQERQNKTVILTRVYLKASGLAAWSENCKWYSSLQLGAVVSLFCELV
jgi:hypothetical protein